MKRFLWVAVGLLIIFLILFPVSFLFLVLLGLAGYVIFLIIKSLRIYIKKNS